MKAKQTDEQKRLRAARAKRTAFGRFVCRLVGDTAGAVMMEYVVLGVLVVAAVVGLVVAFGDTIGEGLKVMISTVFHHDTTRDVYNSGKTTSDGSLTEGVTTKDTVHNEGGGGTATGQ